LRYFNLPSLFNPTPSASPRLSDARRLPEHNPVTIGAAVATGAPRKPITIGEA